VTVKEAAGRLGLAYHQVQYLLSMGAIEGTSFGRCYRIFTGGIEEYDKRGVRKLYKHPARYFVYPGRGELFSCTSHYYLQAYPQGGVKSEKRHKRAVGDKAGGPDQLLLFPL
jgi:excisionase family DNA binding protein